MDPRYRAILVISSLLTFLWAVHVVWTVLLGTGADLTLYTRGVMVTGGGALAGFIVVWAAAALGNLRKSLKTGFEAEVVDEFGTGFEMVGADGKSMPFKLSLSKFLPQMVAPPSWPGLHPLEAELLGFLQGYRHWPISLKAQNVNSEASGGKEFTSLYEQAVARWQVIRHMPGSGPWHRVAALSKDLALVHAYREVRTTYPLWQVFKRDKVKFVSRCQPHGGITAFVISTFPAFRELKTSKDGNEIQKALLIAMRYHTNPTGLPLNSGPLARELVDFLWRADAQLQQLDVRELDHVTPEQLEDLRNNIKEQWLGLLSDLKPGAELTESETSLKLADGSVWMKQGALLAELATLLKPALRQALGLWETGGIEHPSWPHLSNVLLEEGLIANSYDGQAANNGCFTLLVGTQAWGPAVKLLVNVDKHVNLMRDWQALPSLAENPEVVMDGAQLTAHAQALAGNVDARLAELF